MYDIDAVWRSLWNRAFRYDGQATWICQAVEIVWIDLCALNIKYMLGLFFFFLNFLLCTLDFEDLQTCKISQW